MPVKVKTHRLACLLAAGRHLALRSIQVTIFVFLITCSNVNGPESTNQNADTTGTDTLETKDKTPPAAVRDAFLAMNDTTLEVTLTWTAPHDDSLLEAVSAYEVRYAESLFLISTWDLGTPVLNPPPPAPPGTQQHCTGFDYKMRGNDLYAAIRSVDEAGNLSEMSNITSVHIPGFAFTGRCENVYTGLPLQGLEVSLTAQQISNMQTNADGFFSADDLPEGIIYLDISSGSSPTAYHSFRRRMELHSDSEAEIPMIPFESNQMSGFVSRLALFKVLTRTTALDLSTTLFKWGKIPIKCYIPSFTNNQGIDYGTLARQAAERWMEVSDWELFSFVGYPPDTGIVIEYKTKEEMGNLIGITHHTNCADSLPLKDIISIVDYMSDKNTTYKILLHELGHTLRLGHVDNPQYIMFAGQPLPEDISEDEVGVLKLLRAIPNKTNMAMYDATPP